MDTTILQDNIERVCDRIAAAALRAGCHPAEVTLIAVSKTQPVEAVVAAYRAGLRLFGENRVEEAAPKAGRVARLLAPDAAPQWHMVGHLQSRKAEDVFPWAGMVHSVDSVKLAARLSRAALAPGPRDPGPGQAPMPILLEVNIAGEETKYGFDPSGLRDAVEAIQVLPGVIIKGLMTMAPIVQDPQLARPVFAGLRLLRDDMVRRFPALHWQHLSMGMTDDFEVAIEEGATLVRIGRAIFGERT